MMELWKNPISTAVSALDMRLSVLDWVSRELADISSYSMACVSLVVMDCLPHGERVLIQRRWLIFTTAANEMICCSAYLHHSLFLVRMALIFLRKLNLQELHNEIIDSQHFLWLRVVHLFVNFFKMLIWFAGCASIWRITNIMQRD